MICICRGGYTLIYKQYHRAPCLRSQPFVSCCLCFMRSKPKSVLLTFDISHPYTIQFFFCTKNLVFVNSYLAFLFSHRPCLLLSPSAVRFCSPV